MKKVTLLCGVAAVIAAAVIGIKALRQHEAERTEREARKVVLAAKPVAPVEKAATNEAAMRET